MRVFGEKEFYYWYKDDGLFAGIVNLFNSSEEVRKNTNDVISRVRRDCNILGIRMSEKINYGV